MLKYRVGERVHATRDEALVDIFESNDYVGVTIQEWREETNTVVREYHIMDVTDADLYRFVVLYPSYTDCVADVINRRDKLRVAVKERRQHAARLKDMEEREQERRRVREEEKLRRAQQRVRQERDERASLIENEPATQKRRFTGFLRKVCCCARSND